MKVTVWPFLITRLVGEKPLLVKVTVSAEDVLGVVEAVGGVLGGVEVATVVIVCDEVEVEIGVGVILLFVIATIGVRTTTKSLVIM